MSIPCSSCEICDSKSTSIFNSLFKKTIFNNSNDFSSSTFSQFRRCHKCGHIRRNIIYDQEVMSRLYSEPKNTNQVSFSQYFPRAKLVEKDIRNAFFAFDRIYVQSITDFGGDKGQISSQLFNLTKESCNVVEYNKSIVLNFKPKLSPGSDHIISNLNLSLHVLQGHARIDLNLK